MHHGPGPRLRSSRFSLHRDALKGRNVDPFPCHLFCSFLLLLICHRDTIDQVSCYLRERCLSPLCYAVCSSLRFLTVLWPKHGEQWSGFMGRSDSTGALLTHCFPLNIHEKSRKRFLCVQDSGVSVKAGPERLWLLAWTLLLSQSAVTVMCLTEVIPTAPISIAKRAARRDSRTAT